MWVLGDILYLHSEVVTRNPKSSSAHTAHLFRRSSPEHDRSFLRFFASHVAPVRPVALTLSVRVPVRPLFGSLKVRLGSRSVRLFDIEAVGIKR